MILILSLLDLNFNVTTIRHFQVVIPDSNTGEEVVVASLSEGNYFGEISLLRLDEGKNRFEQTDFFKQRRCKVHMPKPMQVFINVLNHLKLLFDSGVLLM